MRIRTVIAAAALAALTTGLGLTLTAAPAAASQIRVLPKVDQTTLKKNCETGGGTYGQNNHGSYWCSFDGGDTIVLCPKKAKNCYGMGPTQVSRVVLDRVVDETDIIGTR